jgi:hypothetical protein
MRRKQVAGPGRSSSGPASSPLFTEVPRRGILGSSRPEIATWHTKTVLLEDVL